MTRAVWAGREVAPASPSEPDADQAGPDGVLAGAGEQVAATVAPVRAGPPRPLRAGVDQRGGISVPAAPVTALAEKTVPQPDAVRVMTVRVANGQLVIAARLAEGTANGAVLLVRAGRASVATVSGAVRPVSVGRARVLAVSGAVLLVSVATVSGAVRPVSVGRARVPAVIGVVRPVSGLATGSAPSSGGVPLPNAGPRGKVTTARGSAPAVPR